MAQEVRAVVWQGCWFDPTLSVSMFFSLVLVIVYYHCQSHPRMFSHWVNRYVFNACIDLINHKPQSHSPVHNLCLYDC